MRTITSYILQRTGGVFPTVDNPKPESVVNFPLNTTEGVGSDGMFSVCRLWEN